MTLPSILGIEGSFLKFRIGRRLVLNQLLQQIAIEGGIANPFLMFSRLFCRLKSADSVLEKIKRNGIIVGDVLEIPEKIPDILGFRIITENVDELQAIDKFLNDRFEVVTRLDQVTQPSEFGYRGIEYSLRYHVGGVTYPFEIQLRTFLQHYWASQSFHLFHKKPREAALKHREALISLSNALEHAEQAAGSLSDDLLVYGQDGSSVWSEIPLRTRIHFVVVEPGEQFATHIVQPLSGNDQEDHDAIVCRKLELYTAYPGSAVIECSCMHFLSFVLNEPHVWVPVDRFGKVVW